MPLDPAEEYVYALLLPPPVPPVPLRGGLEVVGAWVEPPAESEATGPSPPGPMEKASNFSTSGASTALPLGL